MAAASAGTSRLGVSDNQKRWLVAGIALNKVLVPQIRPFVEQEVNKEYNNLKTSHNIHAQTTSGRLQRWPPRKFLKYENINGNDAHPKLSGGRYDYSLFDCRVLSHIDFARLYVDNYMAKFNAFDEHCDASAVLLLLGGVPVFSAAVQAAAGDVRMARNDWAHCVFSKWDEAKFQQSFIEMEDLVRAMVLPAADKGKILGELKDWETKGPQLCMNSPVDPALLHLVHQEVKSLEDNLDKLSVEFEEERAKVRQLLRTVSTDLEQMRQSVLRLKTGQQNLECRTGIVEERMDDVEGRINDFEEDANQRIGNLESFQQNTESRSGQVESRMDNMENRMEDFQETFQSLTLRENESTLTSSPQDMPAAMPEKLVELIRRDYKGAVLCPFPWCEDELQLELCNVFTRLQIVSKKKERAKLTDDTVNMTDVFRPHAECNKPRVVLIEGVPGMGKTTYCQKLAYDWSIGEIPPEASFPGVEMLLLLKCRDMNTADIEKAIDDQLLPQDVDEKEKKNFFHFIRSNQSRILLVLDGLDELRQDLFQSFLPLIQGKVFFNTYVMLTARHEAGKKVRRHCDTLLEIVGYTHDDAKSYVKKYFSNHEDPSLGEKMITKLQSDGQLKELTSNPLNTALLCLLCEETSGTFPSKRTTIYDALVECAIRRYFTKRGVSLDDGNPTERFADQLIQLGKVAFEALLKNQLYFSADEMECQTTDFLQLCFLSREPSASKIRPTPCYAFTHKTFQEYFAALYLAHQVLTGDQGGKALLARLSPVDNWQVWEFLLTMVISKNSEKGVFVVSRLCSFYCKRPRHLSTMGDADADADSNVDICESHPFEWIASCGVESWSEDESALDDVVKKALHFIAECEDGKNELEDYQKKMVQVVARCLPVHKLELELDLELSFCFVYSEYLKTNCTLTDLHLHGPLSKVLLTTISSALHPKNKLLYLHLSDMLFLCRSEDSDNLAKHDNGFDFKMLGTVLQSGHCLTHFNLHDIQIFDDGGEAVAKALQGNHTITHLHLESVTICDSGAIALACFLQSNCTLSHLSLLGSWISGIGAGALADGLQSNRTLKSLNLSDSRFGDSVARGLARVLKSQCAMRYLKLSNSFDWTDQNLPFSFRRFEVIRTSGASALARALRLNYSLTYLDLQYNAISDSGAAATAEALKSNCTLTELYLNENKIGESGGEALGKALQSNRTLTHLLLGRNRIGDSGAKAMAKALQSRGTQLTCLGLCSNKISCSGATAIADSLQCNCSITHLGLSDNEIASSGAVAFAKALQSNCTLTQSDVRDNDNNNDSGATESAQAPLHHNNTLIYLDLESNPIGSLGADILGELSERSSCTVKYGRPQD